MAGLTIALDDTFELWESGVLSVPWDFRIEELQPQLQYFLSEHKSSASNSAAESSSSMSGSRGRCTALCSHPAKPPAAVALQSGSVHASERLPGSRASCAAWGSRVDEPCNVHAWCSSCCRPVPPRRTGVCRPAASLPVGRLTGLLRCYRTLPVRVTR